MAYCQSVVYEKGTDKILFQCWLTENHGSVFKRHYDKPTDTEWWFTKGVLNTNSGRQPLPLYETRTANTATITSAGANTGTFEVIND